MAPSHSFREMKHLLLGSSFALQTMWAAGTMLSTGGVMLSEHPGVPADSERVSVWRLAAMQLLFTHPAVALHHVPQGLFGATSWKRTGLPAVGLPFLERSMRKWRTTFTPPQEQAIGLGPNGFRTAQLKEYPREFSGALAQVIHDHLMCSQVRECEPTDPEWTKCGCWKPTAFYRKYVKAKCAPICVCECSLLVSACFSLWRMAHSSYLIDWQRESDALPPQS